MTSRVYGATEDKILRRLEKDLHVARTEEKASWRMLAALIKGAAVPLSEAVGETWGPAPDLVEVRAFGDPEPRHVPAAASPEFWNGDHLVENPVTGEQARDRADAAAILKRFYPNGGWF